ncbi:MAG: integrase arm-type DNA-binding domain-containing protein [Hyphomonadaceae bacterium]
MAQINLLKPRQVTTLPVGFHSDGSNLYLRVTSPTSRQWVFRYSMHGKVRQLGLGSTVERGITDARALAQKMREAIRDGLEPSVLLAARDPDKMTFRIYAEELIEAKRKEFRSEKWGKQWSATLAEYVYPGIGEKRANDVTLSDIEAILRPMWNVKTETASRVRSRIAAILDYAYVAEGLDKRNPATFSGNLEHRGFGRPRKINPVRHHPAAPYSEVPTIMAELREVTGTTALCLRFTILTWARSSEARAAAWEEISPDGSLWTIPARRMKAGREHQVPLCEEAGKILTEMSKRRRRDTSAIFPGARGGLISDVGINKVLHSLDTVKRLDAAATEQLRANLPRAEREGAFARGVTVHGFRSSARSWGAAKTIFPRELLELSLAHENTNKVESAYQRDKVLEKRGEVMAAWDAYCRNSNVVPFVRSAPR